jgi:hypothetical protein
LAARGPGLRQSEARQAFQNSYLFRHRVGVDTVAESSGDIFQDASADIDDMSGDTPPPMNSDMFRERRRRDNADSGDIFYTETSSFIIPVEGTVG